MSRRTSFNPSMLHDFEMFKAEFGNSEFSLWDYLNYRGDFELAAAFCNLFYPEFIEVEGCVLLAEQAKRYNFAEWKQKLKGDREKIEAMINHVHVYDLFLNSSKEGINPQTYEHIGRTLLKCWSCALRETFPDKHFQFDYATEPEEYGPTITFFQET